VIGVFIPKKVLKQGPLSLSILTAQLTMHTRDARPSVWRCGTQEHLHSSVHAIGRLVKWRPSVQHGFAREQNYESYVY